MQNTKNHFPLYLIFTALFLILFNFNAEAQFFTRVQDAGPIVTDSSHCAGGSWCDINADGYIDMYVGGIANFMYINNRNGTFSSVSSGHFITSTGFSIVSAWSDYDNDGNQDMYLGNFVNSSGQTAGNYLYKNNGSPDFTMDTVNIGNDKNKTPGANWIDYDYDGDQDLFVPGATSTSDLFYRNDGNNTFTRITNLPFLRTRSGDGTQAVFVDYDNDRDLDLFIVNWSGINQLYKSYYKETGRVDSFVNITNSGLTDDISIFDIGCNWGDYDNDGNLDMFLAVSGSIGGGQPDRLYHNNGDGTFTRVTNNPIVNTGSNTSFGVWGDYDNDGDLDISVAQVGINPTPNALYRNDGNGTFVKMTQAEVGDIIIDLPAPQSGGWGDYDNDGDLDLYSVNYAVPNSQNGTPAPNYLIRNDQGNLKNWVLIKCIGTTSNRDGAGARIKVKANINSQSYWQNRFVQTGTSSFAFQEDMRQHFGLGNAAVIDSIIIEWPSGATDIYTNIGANNIYKVTEGMGIAIGINNNSLSAPENFKLYQNYPNPFNPVTTIEYELIKGGDVKLNVYDILGKEVVSLVNERQNSGLHSVRLNASDLSSGIYFYEMEFSSDNETFSQIRKMTVLK